MGCFVSKPKSPSEFHQYQEKPYNNYNQNSNPHSPDRDDQIHPADSGHNTSTLIPQEDPDCSFTFTNFSTRDVHRSHTGNTSAINTNTNTNTSGKASKASSDNHNNNTNNNNSSHSYITNTLINKMSSGSANGGGSGGKKESPKIVLGKYELYQGKHSLLGEGSFSSVYKGRCIDSKKEVAIKMYKYSNSDSSQVSAQEKDLVLKKFKRQIMVLNSLLAPVDKINTAFERSYGSSSSDANNNSNNPKSHTLDHPLIRETDPSRLFLKLIDYTRDKDGNPGMDSVGELYVVTEVADYSLKDYLSARYEENAMMSESTVKKISKNFCLAVGTLHAKGLVHLDIKPENLMKCCVDSGANGGADGGNTAVATNVSTWRLIDVDGCTTINTNISINDSSISFSPCYCAPEWAHFLIEDAETLKVSDQLDVWSVGISLCELIMLDAVLKPKYANIYKQTGSHRKAGFLFLEWLSKREETLDLDKRIHNFSPEFKDMVLEKMLTKSQSQRWSLAECLNHPFLSSCAVPGLDAGSSNCMSSQDDVGAAKMGEKAQAKRRERLAEKVSDKPPLLAGVLYKLNSDGDSNNPDHWLKRDMWLAHNGSLCYFSQKKGRRLVLLDHTAICRGKVKSLDCIPASTNTATNTTTKEKWTFELRMGTMNCQSTSGGGNLAVVGTNQDVSLGDQEEVQLYATESEAERVKWMDMLQKVISCVYVNCDTKLLVSKGLIDDYRGFRIQIRNRRAPFDQSKPELFESVFKRDLWKLNQEGDIMNPDHWLKREMWLARNGSFCYFSEKAGKELQYYKSEDIKSVICAEIPSSESCRPFTFSLTLKPADGLEYAPGIFSAESEESMRTFLGCIKKFQSRTRAARGN